MADIVLQVRDFTGRYSGLNGTFRIPVSLRTYLRAALTIGFQNGAVARKASRPLREYRLNSARGQFGLFYDVSGGLCLHPSYHQIESSEKGALTFRHAAIVAKIVAEQHMQIPWLANVDEMRRQGRLTINETTNERGDYVGLDQAGAWHVFEAKGRSGGIDGSLLAAAKSQASRIEIVDEVAPHTRSACVTDLGANPITATLVDPPPQGSSRKSIRFSRDDFAQFYYGNVANYIRAFGEQVRVDGLPEYSWASIRGIDEALPEAIRAADVYLGLPTRIVHAPRIGMQETRLVLELESPYAGLDQIALAGRMPDWQVM